MNNITLTALCVALGLFASGNADNWKPVKVPVLTMFEEDIDPNHVLQEHPRPQLMRDTWQNLNGLWNYSILEKDIMEPSSYDGKILVPFCVEAPLSGVGRQLKYDENLWYMRTFMIPKKWKGKQVLLNFEAVDWECDVWVNNQHLGRNQGGYTPFSFNITSVLKDGGEQVVKVRVSNPGKSVFTSVGKQTKRSEVYETVSGIWQTVWLEAVSDLSVKSLKIDTDIDDATVIIDPAIISDIKGYQTKVEVFDADQTIITKTFDENETIKIAIKEAKLWSPDSPHLYPLRISLIKNNKVFDVVESYFGMRAIYRKNINGMTQIYLNHEPIFQYGPLDQGYWPGSVLTPPSEEAIIYELEYLKKINMNMVRLHIKTNPGRWYYHCDRLGLLVWQDFVCATGKNIEVSQDQSLRWRKEQERMINSLYNHPSIVMWILFNEAWGQHSTQEVYNHFKEYDKTRLWSVASGWYDLPGEGDIRDLHDYTFRPAIPVGEAENRAIIFGECGGFASAVPPHNWLNRTNQKGSYTNPLFGGFNPEVPRDDNEAHDVFRPTFTYGHKFGNQYSKFIDNLCALKSSGLTGAVYTQFTDMKREENGLLTFDRKVSKIDIEQLAQIHQKLYETPKSQFTILESSLYQVQEWEMATMPLPENGLTPDDTLKIAMKLQTVPGFETFTWKNAIGPFGNTGKVSGNSRWNGKSQLFIRKSFEATNNEQPLIFCIYNDLKGDGATWMHSRIYLNGEFVADETTRQFMQELRMSEVILPESALQLLRKGENEIIIQFVPDLQSSSGNIVSAIEDVLVDVSIKQFAKGD